MTRIAYMSYRGYISYFCSGLLDGPVKLVKDMSRFGIICMRIWEARLWEVMRGFWRF